jgi:hypothetical protein
VTRCPHCHAQASVERSAALHWRCGVCGGPIVPTDEGIARSNGELAQLVAAQRTRAMALGWTAAAVVLGAMAAMGLGLAGLVWLASHAVAIVVGAMAMGAMVLAVASARRAKTRGAESRSALEQAWGLVAGEVVRARPGETTAAELAKAMQTDEDHAQGLLTRLSTEGRVRVDVRDDAELAYRAEESAVEATAEGDAAAPGAGRRGQ